MVPDSPRVNLLCDGPTGPAGFRAQRSVGFGLGSAVLTISRRPGALLTSPAHRAGRTHAIRRYEEKE